jgi:hypothetical protein
VEVTQTLERVAAQGEAGQFEEAQAVLSAHEGRLRSGPKTKISEALALELQDARERMQSRSSWEDGGLAEVRDAMQMHKMQRCTNMSVSKKCMVEKRSKGMYVTSAQHEWIAKSSG